MTTPELTGKRQSPIRTVTDPQEKALLMLDEAREWIVYVRRTIKEKRAELKAWQQEESRLQAELSRLAVEKAQRTKEEQS